MSFIGEMKMFSRFAWGLRGFLRHPLTLDDARAVIERRLAEREANFLRLLERGIFNYAPSPYLPLLKLADCEIGDIKNLLRAKGLEKTLHHLRDAGVYISFEEFKGRKPLVRGGQMIALHPHSFDNPFLSRSYITASGGTTGAQTRVETDLDHLAAQSTHLMLARQAHGVLDVPTALWRGILPDGSGINNLLRAAHLGRYPQRWFSPIVTANLKASLKYKYHLATYTTVVLGRVFGKPLPWPEMVGIEDAIVVARWASETLQTHGACLILSPVSRALRVCVAAQEAGLDLTGATFMIAGEPPTAAKVKGIESTGARYFPTYGLAEAGRIGMGCAKPTACNDLHLLTDAFAVIQKPRAIQDSEIIVEAFNVTALLLTAPKLMLNVEIDDYGIVENRACGCPLEELGFSEHLRDIRSFSKLTGEGVTLVGSEMVHILEEVLPTRFGGSALDYQLMEEEDEQGFTRLSLLVNPRLEIADEAAVIDAVLAAMEKSSVGADSASAIWKQAKALRVKRQKPVWTGRGKLMPLHLANRSKGAKV
ncbi:MAG: hypothetical protein HY231_08570 [Acidobacteria bacterium]|nr:hypothetical protein [Acidobacteriota bacterium]